MQLFSAKSLKLIEHSSPKRRSNASLVLKISWLALLRAHRERRVGEGKVGEGKTEARKVEALKVEAPSFEARGSIRAEAEPLSLFKVWCLDCEC